MQRSVDSIGTCSLDVEASADIASDCTERSSAATLHSAFLLPSPIAPTHLPSYLSLACTVNGYSTTTNYDSIRLSRSRDVSPHRFDSNDQSLNCTLQHNLLSPPNIVPLPVPQSQCKMTDNTIAQQYFSSTKTTITTRFVSNISSNIYNNGKTGTMDTKGKELMSNGVETKSVIQQRVERLYGPGALAQGFFVSKRQNQKNRNSESELDSNSNKCDTENHQHSTSMNDNLYYKPVELTKMKQSTSSPTLPVLRHLRPEFRAQLPIISSRKNTISIPKSVTEHTLNAGGKINGCSSKEVTDKKPRTPEVVLEKNVDVDDVSMIIRDPNSGAEKDGQYFLKVIDQQSKRILALADEIDLDLETTNLSEEVVGRLRSAAGKARLLVSQKIQQFKGLCRNNITQGVGEAFPTTNEDLQGFWDMVMLQVHQVDEIFEQINALRKNNWIEVEVADEMKLNTNHTKSTLRKMLRPSLINKSSSSNEEVRKVRDMQRKKIIEDRRKAMRAGQQKKPNDRNIEFFVPESS